MEKIRKLLPYNPKFGPQPNDEKHFFVKAQIGEVFVFSPALDFKTVHRIAGDNGFRVEYCENGTEDHKRFGPYTCKITSQHIVLSPISNVIKIDHHFSYKEYGPFVYIFITTTQKDSITVDNQSSHKDRSYAWNACLSRNDFDQFVKQYGTDMQWFLDIRQKDGNDIFFTSVVQQRMAMYLEGKESEYKGKEQPDDVLSLLEQGKYNLIVRDLIAFNSFFYGQDGNPIYRKFRMSYKNTGIYSNKYDIAKMAIYLRACEGVSDVNITNSAVMYGDSAIDFTFVPTHEFFSDLAKMDEPTRTRTILTKLGVQS